MTARERSQKRGHYTRCVQVDIHNKTIVLVDLVQVERDATPGSVKRQCKSGATAIYDLLAMTGALESATRVRQRRGSVAPARPCTSELATFFRFASHSLALAECSTMTALA